MFYVCLIRVSRKFSHPTYVTRVSIGVRCALHVWCVCIFTSYVCYTWFHRCAVCVSYVCYEHFHILCILRVSSYVRCVWFIGVLRVFSHPTCVICVFIGVLCVCHVCVISSFTSYIGVFICELCVFTHPIRVYYICSHILSARPNQ